MHYLKRNCEMKDAEIEWKNRSVCLGFLIGEKFSIFKTISNLIVCSGIELKKIRNGLGEESFQHFQLRVEREISIFTINNEIYLLSATLPDSRTVALLLLLPKPQHKAKSSALRGRRLAYYMCDTSLIRKEAERRTRKIFMLFRGLFSLAHSTHTVSLPCNETLIKFFAFFTRSLLLRLVSRAYVRIVIKIKSSLIGLCEWAVEWL
jgi:hypothetical protein